MWDSDCITNADGKIVQFKYKPFGFGLSHEFTYSKHFYWCMIMKTAISMVNMLTLWTQTTILFCIYTYLFTTMGIVIPLDLPHYTCTTGTVGVLRTLLCNKLSYAKQTYTDTIYKMFRHINYYQAYLQCSRMLSMNEASSKILVYDGAELAIIECHVRKLNWQGYIQGEILLKGSKYLSISSVYFQFI